MAPRKTRSPSPTGSLLSSSRRNRRDDDRYARDRRDDGRGHRDRRSRSRSAEVGRSGEMRHGHATDSRQIQRRHRERDINRAGDKPIPRRDDRRDDNVYRPVRRDRSRERRRSRSPRPDRRNRSREYRDRREGSRDRDRRRRDGSTDSKRRTKPDGNKDTAAGTRAEEVCSPLRHRTAMYLTQQPKTPGTDKAAEAEKKKQIDRLAKLEAWKAKQAAEREKKLKEAAAAGGARTILEEMDKKAIGSPAGAASPGSPAGANGNSSPVVYAGQFDPKAIVKRATATHTTSGALGLDVTLPSNSKASATLTSSTAGAQADKPKVINAASGPGMYSPLDIPPYCIQAHDIIARKIDARPLKASGNLSGFGFRGKAPGTAAESEKKRGLDFGDEESTRKKLEKLPTPPQQDITEDAALANVEEDGEDDDVDMADAGTEEEAAAAARIAAEKREERLQSQVAAEKAKQDDIQMEDAQVQADEEEDEDPLDAFMSGLGDPMDGVQKKNTKVNVQERQATGTTGHVWRR